MPVGQSLEPEKLRVPRQIASCILLHSSTRPTIVPPVSDMGFRNCLYSISSSGICTVGMTMHHLDSMIRLRSARARDVLGTHTRCERSLRMGHLHLSCDDTAVSVD